MKENIKEIMSQLNRDDILSILTNYGYTVSTRDYKFCLREESTPSAIINQDNSIHDYGSGFHGDILDILQEYQNLNFKDALEVIKAYIGIGSSAIVPYKPSIEPKKEYISTLSDEVYQKMIKILEWYESKKELQTFKNPDYRSEAEAIAPLWVYKQTSTEAIERFRSLTSYDFKNKTLVIKIHDYQGKLISYKRRRLNASKWITAKDTHPNKQCLVNNKALKDEDNNFLNLIYIVEGQHDFLTALLLDIDVLMIPTVSYKSFTEYEVSLLKNRDVIFIPDYAIKKGKEDLSGVECMRNLGLQIDDVARNTKLFSLPKFLENEHIPFTGSKLDLSEVIELWSGGLKAFINTLEYRADKDIFYNGGIL